jgi:hypothetical protein
MGYLMAQKRDTKHLEENWIARASKRVEEL